MNLKKIFEGTTTLNGFIPIVDMARINKEENCKGVFPYSTWEVKMWSNDHNPPHFHIIRDGWNVSFLIEDGSIFEVKTKGAEKNIFDYMCKNVNKWLDSKCFIEDSITNKKNALNVWNQIHD